uniref:Uncharacterized protein n=1 Tax=Kalanchoe fedtschenkoi TaxID=63787 RepID=A0A7N0TIE9_KALFE
MDQPRDSCLIYVSHFFTAVVQLATVQVILYLMIAYAVILAIGFNLTVDYFPLRGWRILAHLCDEPKDLKIGMCIYGSYLYGEYIFIFFVLLCCVIQQMHILFNLYIRSPYDEE